MNLDALTAIVKIHSMKTVMAENYYFTTFGGNTMLFVLWNGYINIMKIHYNLQVSHARSIARIAYM